MLAVPLRAAQYTLTVLTVIVFVLWLIAVLFLRAPAAVIQVPSIPPPDPAASADEVRARTSFYTDVTAAQRQNAAFEREFVATHLLQPVLSLLLTALVAVVGIQTAPAVITAWWARDPESIKALWGRRP